MRTFLRSKALLVLTFGLLLAVPAVALADDIRDGLDTTAQQTQTITAGDSTSTGFTNQYWIVANGAGTSPSGCDVLAEGDSITATFKVNTPDGVTASASSLTFDECRAGSDLNSQTVKFTSNTPGTYTIPALTKTSGTGVYTTNNTTFTLVVNDNCPSGDTSGDLQDGKCTSNTAPQVSVSGVNAGGNYEFGSEPTATCDVTDAEDANESATPVIDRSALNSHGLGTVTVKCSYTDAGNLSDSDEVSYTIVDTTAPVVTVPTTDVTAEATGPTGANVSFNNDVSASDLVDGNVAVDCTPASGSTFAIATTTVDCSATDAAGNEATGSFTVKVQDTIAPSNFQFVGNINDGDSFFFGSVPDQPTCTATDGGSGLNSAGCVVSGYSTAVGTHTLKATATDKAGNTATKEISYTVKAWTTKGFYAPVDMGGVVNTVKGGSTVPLKFELFAGSELTDTSAIKSLTATKSTCAAGATEDAIEVTATGGTSLRYDSTAGQFIYNWKTPTGAGCYTVTMTAQDGSTITAYFKSLK